MKWIIVRLVRKNWLTKVMVEEQPIRRISKLYLSNRVAAMAIRFNFRDLYEGAAAPRQNPLP